MTVRVRPGTLQRSPVSQRFTGLLLFNHLKFDTDLILLLFQQLPLTFIFECSGFIYPSSLRSFIALRSHALISSFVIFRLQSYMFYSNCFLYTASKVCPSLSFQTSQPLLLLPMQKSAAVLGLGKVLSDSNSNLSPLLTV